MNAVDVRRCIQRIVNIRRWGFRHSRAGGNDNNPVVYVLTPHPGQLQFSGGESIISGAISDSFRDAQASPEAAASATATVRRVARPDFSDSVRYGAVQLSSRYLLSPLAGFTTLPFRRIVRRIGGVGLATTDLVSSRALLSRNARTMQMVETHPEDRPFAVQISSDTAAYRCRAVLRHTFFLGILLRLELELPSGLIVRSRMTKEEYAQQGLKDGREVSFQIKNYRVLASDAAALAPELELQYQPPPTMGENI